MPSKVLFEITYPIPKLQFTKKQSSLHKSLMTELFVGKTQEQSLCVLVYT